MSCPTLELARATKENRRQQKQQRRREGCCLPFFGFRVPVLADFDAITFFVNAVVVSAARTVFLVVVCFEGSVAIFPSDALLGVNLYVDLCLCCSLLAVVTVRRREEAQGNGDFGVKVQIAGW